MDGSVFQSSHAAFDGEWEIKGQRKDARIAASNTTLPDSLICHNLSSADYGAAIGNLEMWLIYPVVDVHVLLHVTR